MLRLSLVLVLCGALLAPAARADSITLHSRALPLLSDGGMGERVGALRYFGGLELRSDDPAFGGLSGFALSADGLHFTAVSDRGHWFAGRLERDGAGWLTGVAEAALWPLRERDGRPVSIRNQTHDAESVARDGDALIVGFERRHRLWRYPAADLASAVPEPLPQPPGLSNAGINGGVEALAVLGPGRYLAVAEELETGDGNLRGWLLDNGTWRDLAYGQESGWKPTDFTTLPNGDLLALERHFSRLGGFTAQIRRIPASSIVAGGVLRGPVIAEFAAPVLTDNYEGIAALRRDDGRLWVYLVSDDNFHPLQRSLLLQFRLDAE